MLRKWILNNFKSVRNTSFSDSEFVYGGSGLDVGELTILAGPNSSGKSTIIQSMLLVAQTLRSLRGSSVFQLQGDLVRLGKFDELVSHGADSRTVEIGWTCRSERICQSDVSEQTEINSIRVHFCFDDQPSEAHHRELFPQLASARIAFSVASSDKEVALEVARDGDKYVCTITPEHLINELLEESEVGEGEEDAPKLDSCVLSNILPEGLNIQFNVHQEEIRYILSVLTHNYRYPLASTARIPQSSLFNLELPEELFSREILGDNAPLEALTHPVTPWKWLRTVWIMTPDERTRDSLRSFITSNKKRIRNLPSLACGPTRFSCEKRELPRYFRTVVDCLRNEFSSIRYIGPLRQAPRSIFPLASGSDPDDVGLAGEFTAYVLLVKGSEPVAHLSPERIMDFSNCSNFPNLSLAEAVNIWLRYLDVASAVSVKEIPDVGIELLVETPGASTWQHLSHVGVGVSQVLPILVMCLLAKSGSILVLEQPELHLHPRVQSRLADFFIAMARMKKQCIVETHGEYWLNRLRRRIAEAPVEELSKITRAYFVTKRVGVSRFEPVIINRYGAVEKWPVDFFDQGPKDAAGIMKAGLEKARDEEADTETGHCG